MKRNASSDSRHAFRTGPPDRADLAGVLEAQRAELRALLGASIRLETGTLPGPRATVAHARRCEIVDLLRHLALDARDAMPAGGTLTILAGSLRIGGADPATCAALVIREVRDDPPPGAARRIRKGRSLGPGAACGVIESAGGRLLVTCRGRETVMAIFLPPAP